MPKHYDPMKVESEVHQNLIRMKALYELRDGKRWTLSDVIQDLIDQQPTINITAEEVKETD